MKNYFFGDRHSHGVSKIMSVSPKKNPKIRAKIISFGKLQQGWDFGQGGPAPQYVVKAALALYSLGESLGLEMDSFPGAGGEISIDFYIEDELVQILINTNLTFELTHERGIGARYDELAYYEAISIDNILSYLINFQAKGYASLWSSSEFYTGKNTKPELSASHLTASRNSMEQYPSLKSSVFTTLGQKFVRTFVDIIKPLQMENLSPFGSFMRAR